MLEGLWPGCDYLWLQRHSPGRQVHSSSLSTANLNRTCFHAIHAQSPHFASRPLSFEQTFGMLYDLVVLKNYFSIKNIVDAVELIGFGHTVLYWDF